MNDVAFVAMLVAFFAVAGLLVRACERIIGPGVPEIVPTADEDISETDVPAPRPNGVPA